MTTWRMVAGFLLIALIGFMVNMAWAQTPPERTVIQSCVNDLALLGSVSLSLSDMRYCFEQGRAMIVPRAPAPCETFLNARRFCIRNGLVSQE